MTEKFKIRKELIGMTVLNKYMLKRVVKQIEIIDRGEKDFCFYWKGTTSRIRCGYNGIKEIRRLIYENCNGYLEKNQRVYQICDTSEGFKCIQPLHLITRTTDQESREWKDWKKVKRKQYYTKMKLEKNKVCDNGDGSDMTPLQSSPCDFGDTIK